MPRMAGRILGTDYGRLHHFVAASPWETTPLERVLAERAQCLVDGPNAVLIIDDTTLLTQGKHFPGRGSAVPGCSGQTGQLSGARQPHACPWGGAAPSGVAALAAHGVDEGSGAVSQAGGTRHSGEADGHARGVHRRLASGGQLSELAAGRALTACVHAVCAPAARRTA
jgi:hypothetical protein